MTFVCEECGISFDVAPHLVHGKRRFCSAACRDNYRRAHTGSEHLQYSRVTLPCETCGVIVSIQPGRLTRGRKAYCSPVCGREGRRRSMLAKNEGYGKLQARARDRGRCVVCGYDIVVDVHHIVPRSAGGGNQLSNLITVCPNHHAMAHRGLLSRDEMLALLAASLS